MSQEMQVNGIDTIQALSYSPPKKISLSYTLQKKQQLIQGVWNQCYIAIIPYCIKCRAPLVWHTSPKETLFHCPSCGCEWIKGDGWKEHEEHE